MRFLRNVATAVHFPLLKVNSKWHYHTVLCEVKHQQKVWSKGTVINLLSLFEDANTNQVIRKLESNSCRRMQLTVVRAEYKTPEPQSISLSTGEILKVIRHFIILTSQKSLIL